MNREPPPHPCRRRAPAIVSAMVLGIAVGTSTAADTAASAMPATPSQRVQQRFVAAVEGWRKAALTPPGPKVIPESQDARFARELRVVIIATPIPRLYMQRRLDGYTFVFSAGWLTLLDELLRAEVVSEKEAEGDCLAGYARAIEGVVADNLREAGEPQRPLQAWPRLAALVRSNAAPKGCADLTRTDLQHWSVQARIDDGMNAAVLWLLARQAALAQASGSADAVESANKRAVEALQALKLAEPRALHWLHNNATKLFDADTARTLTGLPVRSASIQE